MARWATLIKSALLAVLFASPATAQVPGIPPKGVFPNLLDHQVPKAYTRLSVWKATEKSVYGDLLSGGRFDVLVVPVQVQHHAFGRALRSLMSAELALAIASTGAYRVPDPYLVARALGDGERRFQPDDVYRLAERLGVKRIIWTYVGHNGEGRMRLSVQRQDRMERGQFEGSEANLRHFTDIAFSDEHLPIDAFQALLPEVLKVGGVEPTTAAPRPVSRLSGNAMPASALAMTEGSPEPARDAYHLLLLAALTPALADRTRERFAEKALLAARGMSPESDGYDYLRARALMVLGQRAAAIRALGTPGSPAEKQLLALLHGNLPEVDRLASQIREPLPALLAELDARALRANYGLLEEKRSQRSARSAKLEGRAWRLFVERAMAEWSLWSQHGNVPLKQLLDREMPVAGFSLADIAGGVAALSDLDKVRGIAELSVIDHARKLFALNSAKWCCLAIAPRLSVVDYVDFVGSVATDNLVRRARFLIDMQGAPESALEFIARIEAAYKDHPQLTLVRAKAEAALAKRTSGTAGEAQQRSAYGNAFNAWFWEQGQTLTAAEAFNFYRGLGRREYSHVDNPFAYDYPFRPFYPTFQGGGGQPQVQIRNAQTALANSSFELQPLQDLQFVLVETQGRPEEFDKILQSLEGRFVGHSQMAELRAEASLSRGDTVAAAALYRENINASASRWKSYIGLGTILLEEGKDAEAAKVFMAYPGFAKESTENRVSISNAAYRAGSLFFASGDVEFAKPLYRIAADLDTGSEASLSSAARLALLDGDLATAGGYLLNVARRYNSVYAYRDYLGLLHASGRGEEAWSAFRVVSPRFRGPQLWETALVGHRVEGLVDKQIADWLAQDPARDAGSAFSFVAMYLLRSGVTDRKPSPELAGLISQADRPVWKLEEYDGMIVRYSPDGRTGHLFGPDTSRAIAMLPMGPLERLKKQRVKSDLVYFAEAYGAMREGRFPAATALLLEAATYYDVRNPRTGYFLPYLAFAAAKQGQADAVQRLLERFPANQMRFDYLLAQAALSALAGKPQKSLEFLELARHRRPSTDYRPLLIDYQYAEICEWLFDATRDRRFASVALAWAKSNQAAQPWFAWPYAIEARLSAKPAERNRAIAITHYLDKASERLARIPPEELKAALREARKANPFTAPSGKRESI